MKSMHKFDFSENWFQYTAQWWDELFRVYKWPSASRRSVLEIGCFEGASTVWMLLNLIQEKTDQIVCIDPFTGSEEHSAEQTQQLFDRFQANIAKTEKESHVRVIRSRSAEALPRLIVEGFQCDFVYVDGSHRAQDVLVDLCLSWPILKSGGLCICDDYLWRQLNSGPVDVLRSPKIAIDAFTTIFSDQIGLLRSRQNYQVAFVKK